ncbi:hypothetical protein AB0M54_24565 [Actinoplanes sp. NPDC051470]|uniref:hypothetical protein n=1 Tax=Actinoplanes sp. NPDC051470 TaxID=3157224 RepID=UPI00342C1019
MTAGLLITGYLAIGAVIAAVMFWATAKGIQHRNDSAEVEQVMSGMERDVSRIPGGVPGALVMTVLLWPLLIAMAAGKKR